MSTNKLHQNIKTHQSTQKIKGENIIDVLRIMIVTHFL